MQPCGEKGIFVYCEWKYKLVHLLQKTVWRFLKTLKIELPCDWGIPLLGIYLKKTKILIWKDICIPIFIAAWFTVVKIWKPPECPSADEYIKKMWCTHARAHTHTHTYTHTGMLLSHKRKRNFAICSNINGLGGYYAEWNKSDWERQILYGIIYMGNLKNI